MKIVILLNLFYCALVAAVPLRAADPLDGQPASGIDQILKVDNDFSRMSATDGAAKAFDFFLATNALEAFADKESPALKSDVLERMRKLDAKGLVLTWTPFKAEAATSDDFGYSFGQWELRKKEGGKLVGYGYYSTVWKKVNGDWKAIFDMGNDSPLEAK